MCKESTQIVDEILICFLTKQTTKIRRAEALLQRLVYLGSCVGIWDSFVRGIPLLRSPLTLANWASFEPPKKTMKIRNMFPVLSILMRNPNHQARPSIFFLGHERRWKPAGPLEKRNSPTQVNLLKFIIKHIN